MMTFIYDVFPPNSWEPAIYFAISIAAIFIALETKINTDDLVKLGALFIVCIGGLLYAIGRPNLIMWIGIVIYVFTLINDFTGLFKNRRWYDRKKNDKVN